MPEQSTGGSLTERPPPPRVERSAADAEGALLDDGSGAPAGPDLLLGSADLQVGPAGSDDPAERISVAVDGWRRALAGSGMPDTLLASGPQATASWLDLTHAHPSGLAQLFAARPTRLSSLFREHAAHSGAWRQARLIRASALVLSAQRGVQGCCLAIGVASWRPRGDGATGPVQAPIVLRGCSIRPRGAGDDDFDLDLEDAVLINPELVRELVETYGIEADGGYLASLAQGEKGFDPRPVYAWLEERCHSLRGFKIERSLVLATFAAGSGAVLADLDAAVPAIAAHRLLGRVAAAIGPELLSLDDAEPGGDLTLNLRSGRSAGPAAGPGLTGPGPGPGPGPGSGPAGSPGPDSPSPGSLGPGSLGPGASAPGPSGSGAVPGEPAAASTAGASDRRALDPSSDLRPDLVPAQLRPATRRPAVPAVPALPAALARPAPPAIPPGPVPPAGPARPVPPTAPVGPAIPVGPVLPASGQDTAGPATDPSPGPSSVSGPAAGSGESRRLAVVGRLGPRGLRPVRPPSEPDPAEELLVVDCDPAQHEALAAALRGENVVIEGPPGSGATHTVAAAIAGLVAAGRRVLVLSPRRASTEALLTRLDAAGIGDLVLDLRDSVGGRPATRTTGAAAALRAGLDVATSGILGSLPKPGWANSNDEVVQTIRRARDLLDGSAEALHEVRQPWGISAYDAMVALAELTGRVGAPTGGVRLSDEVLARTDAVTRERLRAHLHAAAEAGTFTLSRADTRWYDAQVTTEAEARRALGAALVLRAGLERARVAMDAVSTAAGLRPATEARGWLPLLDVLLGVRAVVDVMAAHIYHQPLDELADAVAPRTLRAKEPPSRGERRRLRKQAQSLVRPGVHVANLHAVLMTASEQREVWRRLSATGDGPRVVAGLSEAEAAVNRVLAAVDVLSEVFTGTPTPDLRELPLDDLERRVFDLAGDSQGILGQPRRATLREGLAQAGLGDLVEDLANRRVGPEQIDAEYDLVWWSSVRDSIVRADPQLAKHDPQLLREASRQLRQAEAARIKAGAELVRTAVMGRAAKVATARPDQVRLLQQELSRDDRRPRMVDLVRRCGDVLSALTPVWMMSPDTVAACLAPAQPGAPAIVDTVVVDDAGHIGLPEVIAALSRGTQVIVAGDRRRLAPPDASTSVIEALAPFARVCRLDRDHRARDGRMLVPLAPRYPEGWQLTPGTGALPPLSLEAVPDGVAIPPPGEELPVSSDAEVLRVVELVELHALRHADESLVVVTLSERHAERIEEALRLEVADRPVLGRWLAEQWQDGRAEPFVVRSVQRGLGVERDAAIVSIGLARTPHGRVLHRFGVLDGDKGAAALTTAMSRARGRTTVVCCFTADDLIVDRLRTAGARLLRDVLLAAGGRGTASAGRMSSTTDGLVTDLRDRLAAAGLPVQVRVGDGAWPLDIAVADPRVPGRMLVAVDLDGPAFSSRPCRERERSRPIRWEQAGWVYCKISAMDLFSDPALEVGRIREAWNRAMAEPLPADVYAPASAVADAVSPSGGGPGGAALGTTAMPAPERADGQPPTAGTDVPPGVEGRAGSVGSSPVDGEQKSDQGGAGAGSAARNRDDERPVLPKKSSDDTDEGWGEREPEDRDEEFRRDRPPHWD